MLKRAIFPILFLAAIASGCKSNTAPLPAPTTSPSQTPSPVPSTTATPTPAPPTPTPSPTPQPVSYQPLANNNSWTYTCGGGATASKTIAVGPNVNGNATFADTLTLSTLPSTVVADEANDAVGNTLVFQWIVGATVTTLTSPGLEFPINPPLNQSTSYQGPGSSSIVMTYQGPQSPLTVPAGTFNNVVLFQAVTTNPVYPALAVQNFYSVFGIGPVRLQFPQNNPPLTCDLTAYGLH